MTNNHDRTVGVSLKMYLGLQQTRAWLHDAAAVVIEGAFAEDIDIFVMPSFLSLATARRELAGSGVRFGAQDVFWIDRGPYTGEISAPMLREAGCTYVEVGHAERRRLFGEDDETTAAKAVAAIRAGLAPIVCIGEAENGTIKEATSECVAQMHAVLDAVPTSAEILFAYEPVWAIGRATPAPPRRILDVTSELRQRVQDRPGRTRLLYGGSAGPGLFGELSSGVDGLFLGRFAHKVANLRTVLSEVAATVDKSCDDRRGSSARTMLGVSDAPVRSQ